MASLENNNISTGKKRAKKTSTHVDMTPMVDLAFLLLTFFILVSCFTKEATLQISFPVKGKHQPVSNAITVVPIEKNGLLYYRGEFNPDSGFVRSDYKKIRRILLDLNKTARNQVDKLQQQYISAYGPSYPFQEKDTVYRNKLDSIHKLPTSLYCIIKPFKKAKYKNVIDLVDEMHLCEVGKYAISDQFSADENKALTDFYSENGK